MHSLFFFGFIVLAASPVTAQKGVLIHRFIVQPSSSLIIQGKTNVNKFSCAISSYTGKDTLVLQEGGRKKPLFRKGYVGLPASVVDCGMQVMTNDFQKTIKADQFPVIVIEFISFERVPEYGNQKDSFKGKLKITLAGVTKTFEVKCSIETEKTGRIHLKGGHEFTFADFNLEAPSRMMGLVKVDEKLLVNFHLVLLIDPNA
jgi:hypothetical protein